MSYKTVCVAGGGVLGSQIAFQAAYCGFDVTIWLRSEGSIGRTQPKIDHVREEYIAAIEGMADGTGEWCAGIADSGQPFDKEAALAAVERAYSTLKLELDLAKAVADADLVIESMAEDTQAKIDFYKKLAPVLPQKTVVVTNSSTLLPSTFAKYTGRPEKYLSLHFANSIWKNNMTEVMAQDQTDKRYFDELVDFANDIRMLALPVNKEKNGYLLNSMLVPWLLSGLDLYVSGVSDPKSIDLAWTRGTGAPKGPFRVFDTVGIQTAYNIVMQYQKVPGLVSPLLKKMMMPYNFKAMASVLKQMLDEGKPMPDYFKKHPVYYAGPAKTPEGMASGSFGPTTAGRMDPYVDLFQSHGGSMVMVAKGNRSQAVTDACRKHGGFYLGSIGGPAAILAKNSIKSVEVVDFPELGMEAVRKIYVEDFPAFVIVDDKGNDFFADFKH